MTLLAERAFLANVRISQWDGRKLDKAATRDTNAAKNAADNAGRYNKDLIGREALEGVTAAVSAARTFHTSRTLPWADTGSRILPADIYIDYARQLGQLREEFRDKVREFIAAYPAHIAARKSDLGDMFDMADYPSADELERKFGFDIVILPVPVADFRTQMADETRAQLVAEVEARMKEAEESTTRAAFERVRDVCAAMVDRLRAYSPGEDGKRATGTFRDSLVGNIRELLAVLPAFNLSDDPLLQEVTAMLAMECAAHEPDELRASKPLRDSVAASAESILSKISDWCA